MDPSQISELGGVDASLLGPAFDLFCKNKLVCYFPSYLVEGSIKERER